MILAKQAATLDRLSKGRFLLGLGLGAWRAEFKAVAAWRKRAHRGNMAAEFTEVLRRLLAHDDGAVSFDGEYVSIRGVALDPKPVQDPLPFCMVGRNDDALDRVARFGNALMVPHGAAAERKQALAERAGVYGRTIDEFDVLAEGELLLAKTHEAAATAYRESRFGQYRALRGLDLDRQIAANWVGTPESVAPMVGAVVEQGHRSLQRAAHRRRFSRGALRADADVHGRGRSAPRLNLAQGDSTCTRTRIGLGNDHDEALDSRLGDERGPSSTRTRRSLSPGSMTWTY